MLLGLDMWRLAFKPNWDFHFRKFDKSVQQIILKKFEKMKEPLLGRGLTASRYQIEEIGQYRIAFIQDEEAKTKKIHFVGDHKQYEKWYKSLF